MRRGNRYKLIETLPQPELDYEGFVDECTDISSLHTRLLAYAYKKQDETTIDGLYHAVAFARSTDDDHSNIDTKESQDDGSEESRFSQTSANPDYQPNGPSKKGLEQSDKASDSRLAII